MSKPTRHRIDSVDTLLDELDDSYRLLIADSRDPAESAVALRLLAQVGRRTDEAVIVTPTRSGATTRDFYRTITEPGRRPILRVVDALSSDQSVAALYTDAPTVYVPSPAGIERLIVAISELTTDYPPADGNRHLVVRSLTPILETVPAETIARVIDCIVDTSCPTGLSVFGCQYTAHSDAALDRLTAHVDGILWVERSTSGDVTLELDHRG
jgi:hypothetical protein